MISVTDNIWKETMDSSKTNLEVKPYDPVHDILEIEGTKYRGSLFREFGCNFKSMVGQVLRIDKKENGVVTVTHLECSEKDSTRTPSA